MKLKTVIPSLLVATIIGLSCTAVADATQKTTWTKETERKLENMVKIGFDREYSRYIINGCKAKARNPAHCVKVSSMVGKAETNAGKTAVNNNVFGFRNQSFASREKAFDAFLAKYNKWWYNNLVPEDFYPSRGQTSKTGYCTDEHSSKSSVGCPNGQRIAKEVFRKMS